MWKATRLPSGESCGSLTRASMTRSRALNGCGLPLSRVCTFFCWNGRRCGSAWLTPLTSSSATKATEVFITGLLGIRSGGAALGEPFRPPVQHEHGDHAAGTADEDRRRGEIVAHDAEREILASERDDRRDDDADQALADDHARSEQHAELLARFGIRMTLGAPVVIPARHRADDDHQRRRRRKINT